MRVLVALTIVVLALCAVETTAISAKMQMEVYRAHQRAELQFSFSDFTTSLKNAKDTAIRGIKDFISKLETIGNSITNDLVNFGKNVAKNVKIVVDFVIQAVETIVNLIKSFKENCNLPEWVVKFNDFSKKHVGIEVIAKKPMCFLVHLANVLKFSKYLDAIQALFSQRRTKFLEIASQRTPHHEMSDWSDHERHTHMAAEAHSAMILRKVHFKAKHHHTSLIEFMESADETTQYFSACPVMMGISQILNALTGVMMTWLSAIDSIATVQSGQVWFMIVGIVARLAALVMRTVCWGDAIVNPPPSF